MARPTWPLGTRFIDSKGRKFEVHHVTMGNPDEHLGFIVECPDGRTIHSQCGDHEQTKVGFIQDEHTEVITETVNTMDRLLANSHLAIL